MPNYVSVTSLCPVIPEPPVLSPDDPPARQAKLLALWYVGATESRFGGKCWTFRQPKVWKDITASSHYRLLLDAARVLTAHDIRPAAWAAFSCDVWKRFDHSDKAPPVGWVYGPKRIEERHGWFEQEEGDYRGGRILVEGSARKLLTLQHSMRACISRECPGTDEGLRRIVQRFFPGNTFEDLLQQVGQETAAMQRDLNARAATGSWLW